MELLHRRNAMIVALACCAFTIVGCGGQTVDVTELYLTALREPENFDSWLATQEVDPAAGDCFRELRDRLLMQLDDALRRCDELFPINDDLYFACAQDEALPFEDGARQASDIGSAIDGAQRFDQSVSGLLLILAKEDLGSQYEFFFVQPFQEVVNAGGGLTCEV